MVRGSAGLLVFALALACKEKSDEGDDLYMDDDVPAGSCMTGTGDDCDTEGAAGSSAGEALGTCASTQQCGDGETCIATFDGDIGEFECTASCIADMDETRWCLDDDACCEDGSVCSGRGYCMPADATADTTGA